MKINCTFIAPKLITSMIIAGGGVILLTFSNLPCKAQFYDDFAIYDDSSYYTDGKDIIWLYGEDTGYVFPGEDTTVSMEGHFPDDMHAAFAMPTPPEDISSSLIHITPGQYPKNITKSIFGFNLADMFSTYNLPDDISSAEQWQWLAELQPQVIRIPSGAPVMFSHLLPYKDADNDEVLDPILGLGYDIFEIARYFDRTDGVMDYPDEAQIFSFNIAELEEWIDLQFVDSYLEYKNRYLSQQNELGSYMDQFIELINYMKGIFPLYNPKVIVVLNIVSETAEQNRAVVDYLLSENINVTGIEMGNECYDKFHCNALGMGTFNQYYWYITGNNILGYANVFQLEDLNYVYMKDHHDFIGAFRGANFLNVKIGLVARGHAANSEYPLRMLEATCNEDDEDWNLALYDKFSEPVPDYPDQKMFDAVIIHSYFETNQYEGILLGDDTHDGIDANLICSDVDATPYYDAWWFDSFDPRLYDAFVDLRTEIKDFAKNGFNESYDAYNATFHFDVPVSAGGKELWPTEWNLKTKRPSYNEADQNMAMIMCNNFMQGVLIQEWWLRYMKLGFRNGYRQGFVTNATFHSFSGGVWEFMLTPANSDEKVLLGKNIPPYNLDIDLFPTEFRNYYVKRTTMFIAEMFSQITKQSLRYLPTNFAMGASSPNVAPTVFVDQLKQNLYIYYTNVTGVEQDFKIYPTLLVDLLDADDVAFGNATIYCIKASKPYSTSGKSKFYSFTDNLAIAGNGIINACYAIQDPDPLIEIDQIFALPNSPNCTGDFVVNGCISVPAYSCGYIKVPIAPVYNEARLSVTSNQNSNFVVYPNPTAGSIAIFNTSKPVDETNYTIEIVGTDGRVVATQDATVAQQLNVQTLPAGAYQCRIIDAEKVISICKFIKL